MTKLEDFRDLTVWQKARELARLVYAVTQRQASVDNREVTEIRNSAVTIGSKIAAAFGTRGDPFSQEMINLAKAACGGLKMQLTAVQDQGWMKPHEYEELMGRITEIRQLLFDLEIMLEFWRKQRNSNNEDLE
jgi:four helix bundle protein